MSIRAAREDDGPSIWRAPGPTIRGGETCALDRDITESQALACWCRADRETFVAAEGGEIVGTYSLRPNHGGGGGHICNCGYVIRRTATGRGVARAMCEHSLVRAKDQGYRGMQFNFVVSSNERAVRLWESYGFKIVGGFPRAFLQPELGYADALVKFRSV